MSFSLSFRSLRHAAASALFGALAVCGQAQGVAITTFHGDEARLGWNAHETHLTPATVQPATFGQLWKTTLDDGVPGSPLYVPGLTLYGKPHDVVYVATSVSSVYALDAATGEILWSRKGLREPVTEAEFTGSWFDRGKHGILSTPVIDRSTGTLYTCTIRSHGLRQQYEVWGLDILTGEVKPGWPVALDGSYGGARFTPGQVMQRGALSLIKGWVYVPFGGRGDIPPWRGWLIGVDTKHPNAPQRAFCTSPVTDGGGIWSGGGVATDGTDAIYVVTGNGDYDFFKNGANLSQSILRLHAKGNSLTFTKQPKDFYTPGNYKFLDDEDEDLGGSSALALPDQPNTGTPHLLFTGGKDGLAYLINRDNLGGIGGEAQKFRLFGDPNAIYHEGIRATPCYFDAGAAGRFVFVAGDQPGPDNALGMAALQLVADSPSAPVKMKRVWTLKEGFNGPSAPYVSSNGPQDGIVWVVETNDGDHSNLRAYEALTGKELYNSARANETDHFNGGRRFVSPIVADGRVFVGADGVFCYGLKASSASGADGKGAK